MYVFPDHDGPESPMRVLDRLYVSHQELHAVAALEPNVRFAFKYGGLRHRGRRALGVCYMPSVQGELRPLFEQLLHDALGLYPDFLIVIEAEWWEGAPEREREILVFHEAMHMMQAEDEYGTPRFNRTTGEPIWAVRPHDVEEFACVARRYGAWSGDLVNFVEALREGEATGKGRARA